MFFIISLILSFIAFIFCVQHNCNKRQTFSVMFIPGILMALSIIFIVSFTPTSNELFNDDIIKVRYDSVIVSYNPEQPFYKEVELKEKPYYQYTINDRKAYSEYNKSAVVYNSADYAAIEFYKVSYKGIRGFLGVPTHMTIYCVPIE